ncbi:uncharacterized protein LOC128185302 [Crassostrea angulata]|uniref:uncharacterized protein LOC128185302 n=1 Tax=Magallana angulata TaxID=2784310 RepID=UPI0022B15E2F|nr:uncharacterized protein LOC128185302 [Crassostrea angulata]
MNENRYCKDAVESVEKVSSCPTSKEQWDKAASKKRCWEKALKQTCSAPEKFVYHCVINGYGNATLEVCAPERLILGHCTEFNEVGGVIQDQLLSPCINVLPRCDEYYLSSEAYKYEGCYKLVETKKLKTSTSQNVKHESSDETSGRDEIIIPVLTAGISLLGVAVLVIFILYAKRRKINRLRDKKGVQTEVHKKKIPTLFITDIESEENSDQQLRNKPILSSDCRNDGSEVMPERQSLIGEVHDQNTLGVSKVKRRQHSAESM